VDVGKRLHAITGVAGGLDSIHAIEMVITEGEIHEVAFDYITQVLKTSFLVQPLGAFALIFVVIETDNFCLCESGNIPERSTNTTTNVKKKLARFGLDA
jgi:hypothetical protein